MDQLDGSAREGDGSTSADIQTRQVRMVIRPLTGRSTAGEPYQRLPAIERQIDEVCGLDQDELIDRARIQDRSDVRYLSEECLVYLIQESHFDGNSLLTNDLAGILIDRCTPYLSAKLGKLGAGAIEDAFDDVIEQLFRKIFDRDSGTGDFLQVRFWMVLKTLAISSFDRSLKRLARETELTASDEGTELTTAKGHHGSALTPEQVALSHEALEQLPEPIREAFILRYYMNWPITSADPLVPTLAERFCVTPRAIRKWFEKADAILENWRGA